MKESMCTVKSDVAAAPQAVVTIDTDTPSVVYNRMIFGGFLEHFDRQIYGGVFEPGSPLSDKAGFREDVIRALIELKVSVIRWPGGCFVDSYHWRNGVGKDRKSHGDFRWGVIEPNNFGTHEFVGLCRRIGAEPYICLNGLASAQENLDWVAYCNATNGEFTEMRKANGHAEPLNVKYWSVGNERYDAAYISRVRDTARRMRELYPDLVVMCSGSQCGAPIQEHLLDQAGEYIDCVSIHDYWLERSDDLPNYSYEQAISKSERPDAYLNIVISSLRQHKMERIRIAFDEWNLRAWQSPGFPRDEVGDYSEPQVRSLVELRRKQNDEPSQYTIADALFAASFFNACLRHSSEVVMANVAPLVNTRGPLFVHPKGIVRRTHFHAMAMYANELEPRVGKLDIKADKLSLGKESVSVVDAIATVDDTGKNWSIALVNRHPELEVACNVSMKNLTLEGGYPALILAGNSPDAFNDIENPNRVIPEKKTLHFSKGMAKLPPHSLTILKVKDNLEFSDPANVVPPQKDAIGFPDRSAGFDVLPGFKNPPRGYGQVPFYWWIGDPLTKERLAWQLEQLDKCGEGITGLQINYAHGYRDGGLQWGLSIPSDPPLFSEAWWELVEWFMGECRRRGWSVSLSDYTLGPGQGWCFDELLKEHPEMAGAMLYHETLDVNAGDIEWVLPSETLMVAAYPLDGDAIRPDTAINLCGHVTGNVLKWIVPTKRHRLVAVAVKRVKLSLDPMHPDSGRLYAEKFFGQFEKRFPGEVGKGLNFFFSDELKFNVEGNLWNDLFTEEFRRRKGYDIAPELPSLFTDCGSRTPKVRLDYSDVMVALSETGFFKPVFDWHQRRGMIYGCDHGGRGRDVTEFGDYFRTQRWNQGPGCDQPNLSCDLIKNKVASSIAHLYQRPRVWLEGYYGSGWGTSTAGLTRATFANFAQGQNLLSLHGLYYSTHGGYWEWAPPCNHFRMPYWPHMKTFLEMAQRLSFVMSQGYHCCDVAILYPVAATEAGLGGKESVDAAFDSGHKLYSYGIDFDFMDFESLDRAEIVGKELHVSNERYRVLVLPAMRGIRWSTLQKALDFQNAGGLVIMLGALPEASDHNGRNDSELNALVNQFFRCVNKPEEIVTIMENAFLRDFAVVAVPSVSPNFMHRKIGPRDLFMIHNVPKDTECRFRATGKVELWDPWRGETRALPILSQTSEDTCLRLPLSENEAQLIVFSPGKPIFIPKSAIANRQSAIEIDGAWEFELQPTMDNQFGDFHWPPTQAMIGAEARRFRYADELTENPGWEKPDFDDSNWRTVTNSFGPKLWKLGPLPENVVLDEELSKLVFIDPALPVKVGGMSYYWKPYEFSWRWGVEGNPGKQGWHGLKENISDDFIILGAFGKGRGVNANDCECLPEPDGTRYYLWTSANSPTDTLAEIRAGGNLPVSAWLNGRHLDNLKTQVTLKNGANPLLLRYERQGRGHFVLESAIGKTQDVLPGALAMKWFNNPGLITYDIKPHEAKPVGWFRFTSPPGLRAMTITAMGEVQAWVEGKELRGKRQSYRWSFELPAPEKSLAKVALRISQRRGCYGGATLPEPVTLNCEPGFTTLGDWSKSGVLECYSGGAWYRKTVTLTKEQAGGEVTLDLGSVVATAEVHVNGQLAGIRVSPPWRFEITGLVNAGDNRIEILVYNTLSNHYLTIPTGYRGDLTSGLLGPATLVFEPDYRS